MIAESPATALPQQQRVVAESPSTLSVHRVAAMLQVLLAARRGARTPEARSQDEAYWYTVARGI
jgi:hypothetical protein